MRTRLRQHIREFSEIFRQKQAFGELMALGHCRFVRDSWQFHGRPSTFLLFCKTGRQSAISGDAMRDNRPFNARHQAANSQLYG
jgi:hypothetical protein